MFTTSKTGMFLEKSRFMVLPGEDENFANGSLCPRVNRSFISNRDVDLVHTTSHCFHSLSAFLGSFIDLDSTPLGF